MFCNSRFLHYILEVQKFSTTAKTNDQNVGFSGLEIRMIVWLHCTGNFNLKLSSQKLPSSLQSAGTNQTVEDWEVKIAIKFFVDLADVTNIDDVIHVEDIQFGHQDIDQEINRVDQYNQSHHVKQSEVKHNPSHKKLAKFLRYRKTT